MDQWFSFSVFPHSYFGLLFAGVFKIIKSFCSLLLFLFHKVLTKSEVNYMHHINYVVLLQLKSGPHLYELQYGRGSVTICS